MPSFLRKYIRRKLDSSNLHSRNNKPLIYAQNHWIEIYEKPSCSDLYNNRIYEQETTLFFRNYLKEGDTVYDIGANIGYYTLELSSNQTFGRPGQVFEENSGQLTISKLTIKINYKSHFNDSEKFVYIDSYKGSISLQSGSYAGQMITTYKDLRPTISLKGKCFGIDQVAKYLK